MLFYYFLEVICEVDDLQAITNTTHTQFIEGRQDSFVIYTCTPGMKFPDMDSVKNRTCVPVEGWYPDITEGCMGKWTKREQGGGGEGEGITEIGNSISSIIWFRKFLEMGKFS